MLSVLELCAVWVGVVCCLCHSCVLSVSQLCAVCVREEIMEQRQKERNKKRKRYVMIGLATVGGGALLGKHLVLRLVPSCTGVRVCSLVYSGKGLFPHVQG